MRDARRGRDSAEGERESTKEMARKMQDHISYNMAGSIKKKNMVGLHENRGGWRVTFIWSQPQLFYPLCHFRLHIAAVSPRQK